nr:histone deacetylase 14 [Tanacetum cinerariifolium]
MHTQKEIISKDALEIDNNVAGAYHDKDNITERRIPAIEKASPRSSVQPQDDTSANIVHESPSPADAETSSSFHLAEEDLRLGNLKFVPKGETYKVFGMSIPIELISNNIRNVPYYNAYLEMVEKHDRKIAAKKEGKKKPTTAKQLKSKHVKEKSSKPAPASSEHRAS